METFPITTIPPEYDFVKLHRRQAIRNRFKSGHQERRALYSKKERGIKARFITTTAEMNTIRDFVDARANSVESFYLHDPDTDTDFIVFVDEPDEGIAYRWLQGGDDQWEINLTFWEIF